MQNKSTLPLIPLFHRSRSSVKQNVLMQSKSLCYVPVKFRGQLLKQCFRNLVSINAQRNCSSARIEQKQYISHDLGTVVDLTELVEVLAVLQSPSRPHGAYRQHISHDYYVRSINQKYMQSTFFNGENTRCPMSRQKKAFDRFVHLVYDDLAPKVVSALRNEGYFHVKHPRLSPAFLQQLRAVSKWSLGTNRSGTNRGENQFVGGIPRDEWNSIQTDSGVRGGYMYTGKSSAAEKQLDRNRKSDRNGSITVFAVGQDNAYLPTSTVELIVPQMSKANFSGSSQNGGGQSPLPQYIFRRGCTGALLRGRYYMQRGLWSPHASLLKRFSCSRKDEKKMLSFSSLDAHLYRANRWPRGIHIPAFSASEAKMIDQEAGLKLTGDRLQGNKELIALHRLLSSSPLIASAKFRSIIEQYYDICSQKLVPMLIVLVTEGLRQSLLANFDCNVAETKGVREQAIMKALFICGDHSKSCQQQVDAMANECVERLSIAQRLFQIRQMGVRSKHGDNGEPDGIGKSMSVTDDDVNPTYFADECVLQRYHSMRDFNLELKLYPPQHDLPSDTPHESDTLKNMDSSVAKTKRIQRTPLLSTQLSAANRVVHHGESHEKVDGNSKKEERLIGHTDLTTFTLILQDDKQHNADDHVQETRECLEVWNRQMKQYVPVKIEPNAILVQAGQFMQWWTCGMIPAAPHRVVMPPAPALTKEALFRTELSINAADRLSVVLFCFPDFDATIEPLVEAATTSNQLDATRDALDDLREGASAGPSRPPTPNIMLDPFVAGDMHPMV